MRRHRKIQAGEGQHSGAGRVYGIYPGPVPGSEEDVHPLPASLCDRYSGPEGGSVPEGRASASVSYDPEDDPETDGDSCGSRDGGAGAPLGSPGRDKPVRRKSGPCFSGTESVPLQQKSLGRRTAGSLSLRRGNTGDGNAVCGGNHPQADPGKGLPVPGFRRGGGKSGRLWKRGAAGLFRQRNSLLY